MTRVFTLALLGIWLPVSAVEIDGSVPLVCAVTHTASCDDQGHCVEGPANAVNLPTFIKLDAQKKIAASVRVSGEQRTSEILGVHEEGGALVLLGVERSGGWTAVVGKSTGKLTLSVAHEGMGYLVLGACIPM
jgi:hypothetical protein